MKRRILEAEYTMDGGQGRFRVGGAVYDLRDTTPYAILELGMHRLKVLCAEGWTRSLSPTVLTTSFDHAMMSAGIK